MTRQFDTSKDARLVVATHNPGKLREFRDLLRPYAVETVSAGELNLPEPEETGDSFIANALIKARASAESSGLPALADDSGIIAKTLDDRPGIESARWAGPDKDFGMAMRRVNDEIEAAAKAGWVDRRAFFVCALALCWPDGHAETFEGQAHGKLIWPARGDKGFGYDPMFVPNDHTISYGEMDPDAKHAISHRAEAFRQLVDACFRT